MKNVIAFLIGFLISFTATILLFSLLIPEAKANVPEGGGGCYPGIYAFNPPVYVNGRYAYGGVCTQDGHWYWAYG